VKNKHKITNVLVKMLLSSQIISNTGLVIKYRYGFSGLCIDYTDYGFYFSIFTPKVDNPYPNRNN